MTYPTTRNNNAPATCAPGGTCQPDRGTTNLLDEFFGHVTRAEFAPPMDVTETEVALIVRTEVPGVDPKEITVSFERNVLTVSGEKKAHEHVEGDRFHRVERRYGRFARQLEFRTPVDGDRIEAAFKSGVLTVTLPKHEKARTRTIEVKAVE